MRPVLGEQRLRVCALVTSVTTRPDEDRDHRVEQRDDEAGDEQRGEQRLRLPGEMPIERHQPGGGSAASGASVGFSSRSNSANMVTTREGPRSRRPRRSQAQIRGTTLMSISGRARPSSGVRRRASCHMHFCVISSRSFRRASRRSSRPLPLSVSSQIAPSGPWRTSRMRSLRSGQQALLLGDLLAVEFEPHQQSGRRARRRTGCPSRPGTGRRCRTPCRRARSTAPSI